MLAGRRRPGELGAEELPPRFREAVAGFLAGNYKECQIAFARAAAEAPRAGLAARAAYGAACCAALRNDLDGGFEALGLALANGFHDLERVLVDPRLETLRADARWLRFLTLTEERQQAHQKTLDPDLLRLYLEQREERERAATARRRAARPPLVERAAGRRRAASGARRGSAARSSRRTPFTPPLCWSRATVRRRSSGPPSWRARRSPAIPICSPPAPSSRRRSIADEMLAGKPQKYGTQLVEDRGQWKVYDVDPAVTDEERAEWGLPPLAEAHARAAELNQTAKPAASRRPRRRTEPAGSARAPQP